MNRTYFWILQAASHQLHFFFFTSPVLQDNSGNEQGAAPSIKTGSVSHNSVAGYGNQDLFFRSAGEPAVEKADGQVFFENKDYWKSNDIYHAHMDLEWFGYDTSIERWWLICSGSGELLIFRWFGYDMFGRFAREKPDRLKKGYTVIPGGHESSRLSGTLVEQFLVWKPWRGWVTNDTTRRRWTQWTSHGSILPYCSHLIVPKMFNNSPIIFSH